MRYPIVLFDADNTLLDFSRSEREAVHDVFLGHGYDLNDEQLRLYAAINDAFWQMLELHQIEKSDLYWRRFETFCAEMGIVLDPKEVAAEYLVALSGKSYLMAGAEDLVIKLKDAGARLFIITNGNSKVQHGRFDPSAIAPYFEQCFISEDVGYNKPDIEFFRIVEKAIPHFDAAHTLVVGDSLSSDITGGIGAGLDTCWYNRKKKECPASFDGRITYTVENLAEVAPIVLQD